MEVGFINTKLIDQFEFELDYYVMKASHMLVTYLTEEFYHFDKQKYSFTLHKLAKVSEVLYEQLSYIEQEWDIVLGKKVLIDELQVESYPKEVVEFLLENRKRLFEETKGHYSEIRTEYVEAIFIDGKKRLLTCMESLVTLSNLSIDHKKLFKKSIYRTIKDLLNNVHSLIMPFLYHRISNYIDQLHPDLANLFIYKIGFLYFQLLVSHPGIKQDTDETLVEAYDTFKEKVSNRLEKIALSDLWFLGNHEFEKCFCELRIKGELQQSKIKLNSLQFDQRRTTLIDVISQFPNQLVNRTLVRLLNDETFYNQLHSMRLELKQLFHEINKSVVDLIGLYEDFELDYLITHRALASKESTLVLLKKLYFQYDELEVGDLLQTERCETLKSEMTSDPTKDHSIKAIHEQGIMYKNEYIRKNLVTIYLFDIEA